MTVYAVGRFGMKCFKVDFRTWASLLLLTVCGSGCTICASPDLESYTTYGGAWHRTDRDHGRVGSVFAPAGSRVGSSLATPSQESSSTIEEVPPGDIVEPGDAASPNGEPQTPPADGEQEIPPKPDLRDLELEDIEVRQRTERWQSLPEA